MPADPAPNRLCHWVFKIGNLKRSMDFYSILGMRVLRHEEFEQGCEATCNGPYGGAWSKTMIGRGPEDSHFALELTYNYGIESYARGDDLQRIVVGLDVPLSAFEAAGFACAAGPGGDGYLATDPDGYVFHVVAPAEPARAEPFRHIVLKVADEARARDYYTTVLGLQEVSARGGGIAVGHAEEQVSLLLVADGGSGAPVDHGHAFGRVAFATTEACSSIAARVEAAGDEVQVQPLVLDTPGKRSVEVTILVDRDGYEICEVERDGFYELATPTYDEIDWAARAARGGDGHPPPQHEAMERVASMRYVEDEAEYDAAMAEAGADRLVFVKYGATWCKKCRAIHGALEELSREFADAIFLDVDVDEADELAMDKGVSRVPHMFVFRGGQQIDEYLGSTVSDIRAMLARHSGGEAAAEATRAGVSEYYGQTLQSTGDLATSACCTDGEETTLVARLLANVHEEVKSKFYGCGSPIPPLLAGATVLDLGCGTGRDCYIAAQLVGAQGSVIGVDMTDEQLAVARAHIEHHSGVFGFANVDFRQGLIEDLGAAGVGDGSVDVVISNCVLNLAPDKEVVMREIWRVLKPGGELYFADIYADRRLPAEAVADKLLYGECLSGALYERDFEQLMRRVGFADTRVVTDREVTVNNAGMLAKLNGARFFSRTVRAFKLPGLEEAAEDYGQTATYDGSVPDAPHAFFFDLAGQPLVTGVPTRVSGNTADMLTGSRYAAAFSVTERGAHRGGFGVAAAPVPGPAGGGGSCAGGGCC